MKNERLLLTRQMSAERLSVSVDTIRAYEAAGKLTPHRRNGKSGKVFHDASQVQALVDEILGKKKVAS